MRFLPIREDPNDSAAPGFIALGNNEDEGVQTPSSSGSRSRGGSDKTTSGTRGGSPSKQQSGGRSVATRSSQRATRSASKKGN